MHARVELFAYFCAALSVRRRARLDRRGRTFSHLAQTIVRDTNGEAGGRERIADHEL